MPKLIKLKSSLDLTHDESRDRLALERKVERAFYVAGVALAQLRDRRLYRSTHNSFEEYCQDRFGMKRRHPYRLIDAAKVVDNILEVCPNGTQIKYKIGQKIKIQSNHSLFGGSSGTIKQIPNHTEVIVELENGQTESISNEYIKLELDSSIDVLAYTKALAPRRPLGQELPSPGIAYGAFCVGSFPHKSRLYQAGIGLEYNVRLSQKTWDKLNEYAVNEGTASLDGAIARLLDLVGRS